MSPKNGARASAPAGVDVPRLRKPPKLRKHRNGARVRLNGRDFYCGPWGRKEAKDRYAELIAEWLRHDCKLPPVLDGDGEGGATVDEIIALYAAHELPTRPASMQARIKVALRPLQARFGSKVADEFSALDLSSLRADLLKAGHLSRAMVNQAMTLIRGVFTWGASVARVDERVPFRLATMKSLRRGQGARERKVVQPIDWPTVDATLRQVSEPVRALVLVQWHTGARPGEVASMCAEDLDRSGKVWVYVPKSHKTEHHGKTRRIFLGAEAQAVVRPFLLRRPVDRPLFSPIEAIVEQKATAALHRRTRVQPSQAVRARRHAARPRREVADGYDVDAYRRALERGVDAANAAARREELLLRLGALASEDAARARIEDAVARLPVFVRRPTRDRLVRRCCDALKADHNRSAEVETLVADVLDAPNKFEHWHPHRLRHSFAQRAERETGDLDAVRASLGHSSLTMAARYAHPDDRKARALAERIG